MKNVLSRIAPLLFAALVMAADQRIPAGWGLAGSKPADYSVTVDRAVLHGGKAAACLRSIVPQPTGFGTLMQTFDATRYREKRLRVSVYAKTEGVANWAGLWMRVDSQAGKGIAFDNMSDRPIKGTTDWTKYSVVLDVTDQAQAIAFGMLVEGSGAVWVDDFGFETVGPEVPTTGTPALLATPRNLGFEE